MALSENIRRQLNRWVNQNRTALIAQSREKATRLGRHGLVQTFSVVQGELRFGRRYVCLPSECPDTLAGRRLRNLLMHYNRNRQAVLIFYNEQTGDEMTLLLNRQERPPRAARRPSQPSEESLPRA